MDGWMDGWMGRWIDHKAQGWAQAQGLPAAIPGQSVPRDSDRISPAPARNGGMASLAFWHSWLAAFLSL